MRGIRARISIRFHTSRKLLNRGTRIIGGVAVCEVACSPLMLISFDAHGSQERPLRLGVYVYKAGEVALKEGSHAAEFSKVQADEEQPEHNLDSDSSEDVHRDHCQTLPRAVSNCSLGSREQLEAET